MQEYLNSVRSRFAEYKSLAEKAMEQIDENSINIMPNENSNSISLIVKHMSGNMISRWTDFLTTDGEKPWRNRDTEFEGGYDSKHDLFDAWNKGWQVFTDSLNALTVSDLLKTITIRNEKLIVIDAINRQFAHYAYHIGQIIYASKMLKHDHWKSLTIPKGKSVEFNSKMGYGK